MTMFIKFEENDIIHGAVTQPFFPTLYVRKKRANFSFFNDPRLEIGKE